MRFLSKMNNGQAWLVRTLTHPWDTRSPALRIQPTWAFPFEEVLTLRVQFPRWGKV